MSLAPPPPSSQDCDVVGWYCTDAGIQTDDDDYRCQCLVVRVWRQEFCRQWRTSRVEQFNGPITIAIRARFDYDSSTIQHPTRSYVLSSNNEHVNSFPLL